jgi:hypothetical protein
MAAVPDTFAAASRIFISLRFGEAMEEAVALKAALEAQGLDVFLCAVAPGDDLASTVIHALHHCTLVVILGTATYGTKTKSPCSTFQELRYIIANDKPFFLVKMCEKFEVVGANFHLTSNIAYYPWHPQTDAARRNVPGDLVTQIRDKLHQVEGRPDPTRGSATPVSVAGSHVATASSVDSLSSWLARMEFADLEPTLKRLGAATVRDVVFAVSQKHITKADLVSAGHTPLRALRFLSDAEHVCAVTSLVASLSSCCQRSSIAKHCFRSLPPGHILAVLWADGFLTRS